ncbi:MAG: N-acetyl-alpha-D-glucosaminyl L-malate synthase BshA, partial [Planctomycetota bacterium]
RIRHHQVEVSSYPLFRYPPYDIALASLLADVVEEMSLDLVHVHYAIPHAVAALLVRDIVRPRRLPVVTTLHGTDITIVGQDRSYARVTRHALEQSDVVTSVSSYLTRETQRIFETERRILTIPNFVNPDEFRPGAPSHVRTCFAPHGECVLIHVSNFRPVKRAELVIEAFAEVRTRVPATLLMVGEGPTRASCEDRARALGLRSEVRFLGAQANVESLLPVADVLLLPSEYESFGLVALEAMACGCVPIATRAGGLPEVIESGVDGLLVPEAEIGGMGRLAADLLEDTPRLERMGEAARQAVLSRFSRDRILPLYEAAYEEALSGSPQVASTAPSPEDVGSRNA